MKRFAMSLSFLVSAGLVLGKVVNGYESNILSARSSLQHLLFIGESKEASKRTRSLKEFILHYELTTMMLEQFKAISPTLYYQIDTLRDRKGRKVDAYIKFVSKSEILEGTLATTNVNHMLHDKDAYYSEYGPHTVSVRISFHKHALILLAHEFGHVAYQVPNLATYFDFFSRQYRDRYSQAHYLGHKPNDPSGKQARAFETSFRQQYAKYLTAGQSRFPSIIEVRNQILNSLCWKK